MSKPASLAKRTKLNPGQIASFLAEAKTDEETIERGKTAEDWLTGMRRLHVPNHEINQALLAVFASRLAVGRRLEKRKTTPGTGDLSQACHKSARREAKERSRLRTAGRAMRDRDLEGYGRWILASNGQIDATWADILRIGRVPMKARRGLLSRLTSGKAQDIAQAVRQITKEKLTQGEADVPNGLYRTIVVDPPWPMKRSALRDRDWASEGGAMPYEPMKLEEIREIELPAADQCHLYLWATQRFLPAAISFVENWEFKYAFTMVWHKSGGMQPMYRPLFNCEFCVVGIKANLKFVETTDFRTCYEAPRREHSRKPELFSKLIQRVSPGPRLQMFTRESLEGFDSHGWEADKYDCAIA